MGELRLPGTVPPARREGGRRIALDGRAGLALGEIRSAEKKNRPPEEDRRPGKTASADLGPRRHRPAVDAGCEVAQELQQAVQPRGRGERLRGGRLVLEGQRDELHAPDAYRAIGCGSRGGGKGFHGPMMRSLRSGAYGIFAPRSADFSARGD